MLAAASEASVGALYVVDSAAVPRFAAALSGELPSKPVENWIVERCARELDEQTVLETDVDHENAPWELMQAGELTYRMLALTVEGGQRVGLVVLGRLGEAPLPCPGALLSAIGRYVREALSEDHTESAQSSSATGA